METYGIFTKCTVVGEAWQTTGNRLCAKGKSVGAIAPLTYSLIFTKCCWDLGIIHGMFIKRPSDIHHSYKHNLTACLI